MWSLGNDFLPVEKEVILNVETFLGRVVVLLGDAFISLVFPHVMQPQSMPEKS